ncbi:unnamed protein product [Gongylonema pulchrum]|uniref:DUF2428 domain-containing protein n=1 Tax=Gongylonema pulchrum TaxID=637853 RepID=A0A183CY86_9BILA|nr:unnamed protein product [Gongylonema pulchrum]
MLHIVQENKEKADLNILADFSDLLNNCNNFRLSAYSEKYLDGDPPLPLVTLLRLIDAVLDEPEKVLYSDASLNQILLLLLIFEVANDEQGKRVRDRCTSLSGDFYIYCQFVRSATSILRKMFASLHAIRQNPEKSVVWSLLRTYSLCCMNEQCADRIIKGTILESFSFFITPSTAPASLQQQLGAKTTQPSFLGLFLSTGFEEPANFFATVDIWRHILPLPSASLISATGFDPEKAILMDKLWSASILQCERHLHFAVLLGISSSQRLRRCLYDLLIRLATISDEIALLLADLKMLTFSAYATVADAFDEDGVEEEESSVRFGAAADVVIASFFAFVAACSVELPIRKSLITVISQSKNYISTILKFFKLASPKTSPHVTFQRNVIKLFRNICVIDSNHNGRIAQLPRDIYVTVCDSLVEHFGNVEHDIETAVLALKALCDIGRSSTFGNVAVDQQIPAESSECPNELCSSFECDEYAK